MATKEDTAKEYRHKYYPHSIEVVKEMIREFEYLQDVTDDDSFHYVIEDRKLWYISLLDILEKT